MVVVEKIQAVRELTGSWRKQGLSIGFVPTMGYLHQGHRSLMEKAREENDRVVVSIFVNPIQFGPNEDFEKYPKDFARDRDVCESVRVDLLFNPPANEMFPSKNLAYVDVLELGDGLCGVKRSGHFRGVCTIVAKLFNIVGPDRAYFGEKDAQQLGIIQRMVEDLSFNTAIVPVPIVRDLDGLALSSRNSYLSVTERQAALVISKSLNTACQRIKDGETDAETVKKGITEIISTEPLAIIDYVDIVDSSFLKPIPRIDRPVIVAVAVFIGKTRLIDNFFIKEGL